MKESPVSALGTVRAKAGTSIHLQDREVSELIRTLPTLWMSCMQTMQKYTSPSPFGRLIPLFSTSLFISLYYPISLLLPQSSFFIIFIKLPIFPSPWHCISSHPSLSLWQPQGCVSKWTCSENKTLLLAKTLAVYYYCIGIQYDWNMLCLFQFAV